MSRRPSSFVAPTGEGSSSCGYCHSKTDSSHSVGLWAYELSPNDYQDLIDRGWRRSGKYLYKPTVTTSCCPPLTIRCRVEEYAPGKGHKKVVKKMRKFLERGVGVKRKGGKEEEEDGGEAAVVESEVVDATHDMPMEEVFQEPSRVPPPAPSMNAETDPPSKDDVHPAAADALKEATTKPTSVTADLRTEPKTAKIKPDRPPSKPKKKNAPPITDIAQLIQEAEAPTTASSPSHTVTVTIARATFTEETYALYRTYQTVIHKDPPEKHTKKGYIQFLVDSPLTASPSIPFGTFHQSYRIDGKLIAVAVLDVLPSCVSSVYFMYDPAYGHLSLGTYSALREIVLVRTLMKQIPTLRYYYMDQEKIAPLSSPSSDADTASGIDRLRVADAGTLSSVTDREVSALYAFEDGTLVPFSRTDTYEENKEDVRQLACADADPDADTDAEVNVNVCGIEHPHQDIFEDVETIPQPPTLQRHNFALQTALQQATPETLVGILLYLSARGSSSNISKLLLQAPDLAFASFEATLKHVVGDARKRARKSKAKPETYLISEAVQEMFEGISEDSESGAQIRCMCLLAETLLSVDRKEAEDGNGNASGNPSFHGEIVMTKMDSRISSILENLKDGEGSHLMALLPNVMRLFRADTWNEDHMDLVAGNKAAALLVKRALDGSRALDGPPLKKIKMEEKLGEEQS
ncbi:Arginyl-tRNA--protein transferase 1 [Thoreauomyces humboldtii]|nr:Arginyl-tRNA--protein transferase 1 [Thoreauomyces humboldtii]